jgi:SAM-dependent methyltransferase
VHPAHIVSPPTVSWPDRSDPPPPIAMDCPNCGRAGEKKALLTVHFATPDHPLRHSTVLCCPDCGCRFYENQTPPDYADAAMLGRGRVAFYLQQGAGISLITRPLARIARPPGSTYLEVGCGFGFGLDFAIQAKGWQGTGIDPGEIAAVGARMLGVPIEQRYLGADEPRWNGACDVVMASETIEHVPSPRAFVATLRRALRPGGVVVLTTPDGGELHEGTSQGMLVPLLSPGLHLVFQTAASLRRLLDEAGFVHIAIETDGTSLVAYASDTPLVLENDALTLREVYGAYLERRAATVPTEGDLFLGFAGRALQEAANDGKFARARRVWAMLAAACRDRFRFDLDALEALPAEASTCRLERLAELIPLNLGGLLRADALRRLAEGVPRPALARRFALAAEAADAMRRALGELAMADGMSEAISHAARDEALLCDAAAGRADVPARLRALGSRAGALAERALVEAVNAGHHALGREIAMATGLAAWDADALAEADTAMRRDALFCLGVLDVQRDAGAAPCRAAGRFAAVLRAMREPGGPLAVAAARGLFVALDQAWDEADAARALPDFQRLAARPETPDDVRGLAYGLARRLFVAWVNAADDARAAELADMIAAGLDAEGPDLSAGGRDAAFCLGVLDLRRGGDPGRARRLLGAVRAALQPHAEAALFWAALQGETEAIARIDGAAAAEAHRRVILGGPTVPAPSLLPREPMA